MCGIVGISWKDRGLISQVKDRLMHRGPDSQSIYVDDNVSLRHRRLSILDLSDNVKQPMLYDEHSDKKSSYYLQSYIINVSY